MPIQGLLFTEALLCKVDACEWAPSSNHSTRTQSRSQARGPPMPDFLKDLAARFPPGKFILSFPVGRDMQCDFAAAFLRDLGMQYERCRPSGSRNICEVPPIRPKNNRTHGLFLRPM